MLNQGSSDVVEQKLKMQLFFAATGLFMLVSSSLFDTWFYYKGVSFSVNAINSQTMIEATNYRHECATLVSHTGEFSCFCAEEACDILGKAYIAGTLYIWTVIVSLPFYICALTNVNRKIDRLQNIEDFETDFFDREIFHYLAPAIITSGFASWVFIVWSANSWDLFTKSDLSLGPAFTNAAIGLALLIGNLLHYVISARKAYTMHLTT